MIPCTQQIFRKIYSNNSLIKACRVGRIRQVFTSSPKFLRPNVLFIKPAKDQPTITTADIMDYFDSRGDYQTKTQEEMRKEKEALTPYLPKSVDELPPRTFKDSFVSAVIPLGSQFALRDRYLSYTGLLRHGRLLEDVDIFAVYAAYQHIRIPKLPETIKHPYAIVTGCVDSIHVSKSGIRTDQDIRMSAHVSYAGKTSLEVCVSIDQKMTDSDKYKTLFEAIFVLVARKYTGDGGGLVNPLVVDTPEEKKYLKQAQERMKLRKFEAENSLRKVPPNSDERELIHNLFLGRMEDGSKMTPDFLQRCKQMDLTTLNTLLLCHPEYRNFAHKIFGGFIMQRAYELAVTNTFIFAKQRPQIVAIDDIIFHHPVDIGAFLRFRSIIGYVEGNYINTPVLAEIIDPYSGKRVESNAFNFTFKIEDTSIVRPLIFHTYRDAMIYLNSRRELRKMLEQKQSVFQSGSK